MAIAQSAFCQGYWLNDRRMWFESCWETVFSSASREAVRSTRVHKEGYRGGWCFEGVATGKSSSTIHLRPVRKLGMRGAVTPQHVFVQRSFVKWRSNITFTCLYNLYDINILCCVKNIHCDLCKQTNHNLTCVIFDAASSVQRCRHRSVDREK